MCNVVPKMLTQVLPHQREAVAWMSARETLPGQRRGGILADDMGLGKTATCIAHAILSPPTHTLVVTPLAVLDHWRREVLRHCTLPSERVITFWGPNRQAALLALSQNGVRGHHAFVLTTYDVLRREHQKGGALMRERWGRVILDEAHCIRTATSSASEAARALQDEGRRWCVTGTPLSNGLADVAALCAFVGIEPYCNSAWWAAAPECPHAVADWRRTFVLRRSKAEALNLPPRESRMVLVELAPQERVRYERAARKAEDACARASVGCSSGAFHVLPWLMRMRQMCVHPSLGRGATNTKPTRSSTKVNALVEACRDALAENARNRVVVFSQWTACLALLAHFMKHAKMPTLQYDGTMSPTERCAVVDRFSRGPRILLCSLQCAAVGIDLSCANHVFFADPWYNPAIEDQAVDRVHRLGQTSAVRVVHFRAARTIEDDVRGLQSSKRDQAVQLLEWGIARECDHGGHGDTLHGLTEARDRMRGTSVIYSSSPQPQPPVQPPTNSQKADHDENRKDSRPDFALDALVQKSKATTDLTEEESLSPPLIT